MADRGGVGVEEDGVGREGAAGMVTVRPHQELPCLWTQPVPASSKLNLPLAKDEPVAPL